MSSLRIFISTLFILWFLVISKPVEAADQVSPILEQTNSKSYCINIIGSPDRECFTDPRGAIDFDLATYSFCAAFPDTFFDCYVVEDSIFENIRTLWNGKLQGTLNWTYKIGSSGDSASNNYFKAADIVFRDIYACPATHPAHIDTNSNGEIDETDLCETYTCDCDANVVNGVCEARTVTWSPIDAMEGVSIEQATYKQLSQDANNQGRFCAREISPGGCNSEGPIFNADGQGNPISCASGQKMQSETDYRSSAGNLSFTRSFVTNPDIKTSGFGKVAFQQELKPNEQWVRNYSIRKNFNTWDVNIPTLIDDNQGLKFISSGNGSGKAFFNQASLLGKDGTLEESAGNTIHRTIAGTEYHFDASDRLIKKAYRNGQFQDYSHPSDNVLIITDNFARSLRIDYIDVAPLHNQPRKVVSKITDPAGNEYRYEYNSDNVLAKVIFPDETPNDETDNPFKSYGYRPLATGNIGLTSITDELNNDYAQWDYDASERAVLSQHNGEVEKVTVEYTTPTSEVAQSSVKHYRDATNYVETLYDFKMLNGSLKPIKIATQACPDCVVGESTYQYDANGYLSQMTAEDGDVTNYQYNNRGLLESITEAVGTPEARTVTTTWHANYNLPLSVDEPTRLTAYVYDAKGNMLSRTVTDKATNETRAVAYTYNSVGQVLTVDGPRADVTDVSTYEYDAAGNLTKVTNALGHETNITAHDAHGKPLSVTDPNGTVTSMTYHPRNWLTSITTDGDTTSYSYDNAGQLTQVTMANGIQLNYEYDAAHRLVAISDAQANRIEYTLDNYGGRTRTDIKDPNGVVKSFATQVFNDLGQLKQTLGANNQTNSFDYDAEGKPTQSADPLNNSSMQQFDALDRLTKAVDPDLGETSFGYDVQDRLTSVTDATGKTTSYAYNAFGEVLTQTSPDTGTSSFTYDSAGNMLTSVDARNVSITYIYDALNRVTSIDYPGTVEDVALTYDDATANGKGIFNQGIGRLTRIDDESGSTEYLYDAKGQLLQETRTINNLVFVTAYQYDAAGLVSRVVYPSGREVDYVRNNLGQITQVTTSFNGVTQTIASNISYLPFGPMQSMTYGNGKVLNQNFDADYRLTNKSVAGVTDLTYGYTARNNINAITDGLDVTKSQSFQYDALARLVDANGEYGTQNYSFDAIGNRLTKTYQSKVAAAPVKRFKIAGYQTMTAGNVLTLTIGNQSESWTVTEGLKETWRWPKLVAELVDSRFANARSGDITRLNTDGVYAPIGSGYRNVIDVSEDVAVSISLDGVDITNQALPSLTLTTIPQPISDHGQYNILGYQTLTVGDLVEVNVAGQTVTWTANNYWKEKWRWPMKLSQLITTQIDSSKVKAGEAANNYQPIASGYRNQLTLVDEMYQAKVSINGVDVTTQVLKPRFVSWSTVPQTINDSYVYAIDSHRLQSVGSIALTHDAIGNTLSKGDLSFSYNQAGRLTTANKLGMSANYLYNAQGERVSKLVTKDSASTTTLYHYDQAGQLLAETDQLGNIQKEYLYLAGMRLATFDNDAVYYAHTDHLGSPIALTDQTGTVQWKGSYDPYGKVTIEIDNLTQEQRFPGQLLDPETGMHYNYFRDYDSEIGRYLQSDPIGLNGGINTYGYVGGNPIRSVDPLGLFSTEAHNYLIKRLGQQRGWSEAQIFAVQNGSKFADNFFRGHQSEANSFMHAMTSDAATDISKTCKKSNDFISKKLQNFNSLKGRNSRGDFAAYSSLGMALHTVMDNRSPAHAGFQRWNNSQIGRHGDNIPLTPLGSNTEEDLHALLMNPKLIKDVLEDMNNTIDANTGLIDCECGI